MEIKKFDENDDIIYICISCVIGAFLGDAIGSYCEFNSQSENNYSKIWNETNQIFNTSKGQITDDSEMALSLSYGLMDDPNINSESIGFFYLIWYFSNPFDIGTTTRKAFQKFAKKDLLDMECTINKENKISSMLKQNSASYNKESLSNGFLMRNTPLAVYLFIKEKEQFLNFFSKFKKKIPSCHQIKSNEIGLNEKFDMEEYQSIFKLIYEECKKDVQLTHSNNEAKIAATFYDFLIVSILSYKNELIVCKSMISESLEKNRRKNILQIKLDENTIESYEIQRCDSVKFNVESEENYQNEFNRNFNNTKLIIKSLLDMMNLIFMKTMEIEICEGYIKFIRKINKYFQIIKEYSQFPIDEVLNESFINGLGHENIGYYFNSFYLILIVLHFFDSFIEENKDNSYTAYRKIMNFICNRGGDTDTNCAIVGGLIGPLLGIRNFGKEYKDLLKFIPINTNVDRLFIYSPGIISLWVIFIYKKLMNSNPKKDHNALDFLKTLFSEGDNEKVDNFLNIFN